MKSEAEISTTKIAFTENLSVLLSIRYLKISQKSVNIVKHRNSQRYVLCQIEKLSALLNILTFYSSLSDSQSGWCVFNEIQRDPPQSQIF